MANSKELRIGQLAQKYGFILNPYPDCHVRRCPECDRLTGQRKVPLLIHVAPSHFVALNYTCRFCQHCDLLVGHKYEIEHLLHNLFIQLAPQAIGNEYLIVGTLEKEAWREGIKQPQTISEMLPHAHDFKRYYGELRMTQGGWFRRDQQPPEVKPPESQEWVKAPQLTGRTI